MKPIKIVLGITVLVVGVVLVRQLVHKQPAAHDGLDAALSQAKQEGKHVLVDFSGSDWCGWCIKLDNEVFSQDAFKDYANDNLVMVVVDFPRDKSKQSSEEQKQNKMLADEFGVRGFPTVYILNPDRKIIAKTGYQAGGDSAYVEHLKRLIADAE